MNRTFQIIAALIVVAASACCAFAQGTISVSPAGISLKGTAGQTTTQHFKVSNSSTIPYVFKVEVMDVVIERSERHFVTAGRSRSGLALRAFPPTEALVVNPGAEAVVSITFVLPVETENRAVAVFFRGQPTQAPVNGPRVLLNIGAVVDFAISDRVLLTAESPRVVSPDTLHNLSITEGLANVGVEPTIARGMAAILGPGGKLMSRAVFDSKRLLPQERNSLHAEFAGSLPSGTYRVLCSLEYSGKTVTRETEFIVP
jgi:hypothetical protein